MQEPFDIDELLASEDARDIPARALFREAATAVLIIAHATGLVVEANPAAAQRLRLSRESLLGSDWLAAFSPASARQLAATSRQVRAGAPMQLEADGRPGVESLALALSTFRVGNDAYLLVRIGASGERFDADAHDVTAVLDELDGARAGFVVTDGGLRIEYANRAFLAMVRAGSVDDVRGHSLVQWLALGEQDVRQLREQMERREATSELLTRLAPAASVPGVPVRLNAIAVPDAHAPRWGFTLRLMEAGEAGIARPRTDA